MKRLEAALFALLVASCASGVDRAPRAVPHATSLPSRAERQERLVGRILAELTTTLQGTYPDDRLTAYVRRVGKRVAEKSDRPALGFEFHITDDPEVDAHAMPGGQVVVSRGTLSWLGSEAELASVLAHEIAHGARRHPRLRDDDAPAPIDSGFDARAQRLDADEERQADALAVEYVARAGYDPHAVGDALSAVLRGAAADCRARPGSCESTEGGGFDPHPARAARLARVAIAAGSRHGERGVKRYLEHLDGLALGASQRQPRLTLNRYVAPGALTFGLPPARDPELSGALLTTRKGSPALGIVAFSGTFWRQSVESALEQSPHQWRQLLGYRVLVGRLGGEGPPIRAAAVLGRERCFLLTAGGDDESAAHALDQLLATAKRAPPPEPPPERLRVVRVDRAASFGAFARRACDTSQIATIARLNGVEPSARLSEGTLVKCVSVR